MKNRVLLLMTIIGIAFSPNVSAQPNTKVSDFNSIKSDGPFNLFIKATGTESIRLDVDDDLLGDIQINVTEHRLKLRLKKKWSPELQNKKANIYITTKNINYIENAGSGRIEVEGGLTANDLSLILSGSGAFKTAIKSNNVSVKLTGSGSITINGEADNANLKITGSGQILGDELKAKTVSAAITGSGNIFVTANESISGYISASGNVVYKGTATVTGSRYTGSGRIVKKK